MLLTAAAVLIGPYLLAPALCGRWDVMVPSPQSIDSNRRNSWRLLPQRYHGCSSAIMAAPRIAIMDAPAALSWPLATLGGCPPPAVATMARALLRRHWILGISSWRLITDQGGSSMAPD